MLQELTDASRCEILILDESESSFDNLFLKDGVNTLLKEVSKQVPVIIATHNNTIGVSVHPDYLIYTYKEIQEDGTPKYHLYSGNPSSPELKNLDGDTISRREVELCIEEEFEIDSFDADKIPQAAHQIIYKKYLSKIK